MKKYIHIKDKIVIGGTLEAVYYSAMHNIPLFFLTGGKSPFPWEKFQDNLALYYWKRYIFLLSLAGLVPTANKAETFRFEDNIFKAFDGTGKIYECVFQKAIIFDEEGIEGLASPVKNFQTKYCVQDWFEAKKVTAYLKHDPLFSKEDGEFVKAVYFFPNENIRQTISKGRDICCVSILSEEELNSYEYTDTYVRLKLKRLFSENGFNQLVKNGSDSKGRLCFRYTEVEYSGRETRKINRNQHADTKLLHFDYRDLKQIIKEEKPKYSDSYLWKIDYLFGEGKEWEQRYYI